MVNEDDRDKDILLMTFIVQVSILFIISNDDRLVPLFIVAMAIFVYLMIKELARRAAK